jgi:hypothetical protein
MVTLRTASTSSAFSDYNSNNIRENNIVNNNSIQVGTHCYLVCIPTLPNNVTKMAVARAVERRILYSSLSLREIKYVKNVILVQGFDENLNNAPIQLDLTLPRVDPCYKFAIVNIEMPPNEHGVYTDYENEFYESVCRGDLLIGEWSNVFLMANPNYYFKSLSSSSAAAATTVATTTTANATMEAAFQKWKYGAEIENYECKVNSLETEVGELQNTVNELLESLRFLSRKRSGEGLLGLKDASKSLSSFMSTLNNKYARICVSDVEFLEINKNMKLKKMLGLVVNVCDDCDACQELIHSLDYIEGEERRRDLFIQIEKLMCRINHSVRKFQLLHLHAERCIFSLKNRAVFTEFASFLNTAVEIVEEVTSRNCTHAQDVDFVKCYGIRAMSKQQQQEKQAEWNPFTCADGSCVGDYGTPYSAGNGDTWSSGNGNNNGYYDYSEDADDVDGEQCSQMLKDFENVAAMLKDFENKFATAAAAASVEQDKVDVEVKESLTVSTSTCEDVKVAEVVIESEEVELVTTAAAVKQEQEQEQENKTNCDSNSSKTKGKWFSWF